MRLEGWRHAPTPLAMVRDARPTARVRASVTRHGRAPHHEVGVRGSCSIRPPRAEIGALDHLVLGELAGRAAEGHAALLHQIEMMRDLQRHVGVLLDQEDGGAVAVELARRCGRSRRPRAAQGRARARPSSSTRGRDISARATASICCSPPESVPASCSRRSLKPREALVHALDVGRDLGLVAALVGAGEQVLAHAHAAETPADSPARARRLGRRCARA